VIYLTLSSSRILGPKTKDSQKEKKKAENKIMQSKAFIESPSMYPVSGLLDILLVEKAHI
jgi:hypothetical protein